MSVRQAGKRLGMELIHEKEAGRNDIVREEALSSANVDLNGILNMPAGPELDALVAKDVMGHPVAAEEHHATGGKAPRAWFIVTDNGQQGRSTIPKYSTDIEASWMVARKMQSRGDMLSLERQNIIDGVPSSAMWTARFQQSNEVARAGTPSLAICRAALLACRHKKQPSPGKQVTGTLFSVIEQELAKVMGPLAPFMVDDKLAEFGASRGSFPEDRVEPFVKAISEDIADDSGKALFTRAMAKFLSQSRGGSQREGSYGRR